MKHRDIAIVGVGMHPWGVFPHKSMPEMAAEAITNALRSANVDWKEIEFITASSYMWVAEREGLMGILSGHQIERLMGEIGVPVFNLAQACATGTVNLNAAYLAVASGEYDVALAVAADKSAGGFFRPQSKDAKFDQDYIRYVMTGYTNPAYWAIECRRRMHDVGTTEDDLAMVKVHSGKAGAHNPYARYQKEFTKEQVLGSPMVCDPLHLMEICATSDGAAAVIIVPLDKAKKYTDKPVLIEGIATGSCSFGDQTIPLTRLSTFPRPGVPMLTESRNAIKALYKKTGRRPEDLDIIELPDNSSWHYLAYLDCELELEPGEAEKMLRRGDLDPIDGKLPVIPSGGLGAAGEATVAHGLYQIHSCVKQLRKEAGEGQVKKDAKVALAQTYGYAGNNAACILSKAW
jgi:acetyl-CoA acetyltransferase